MWGHVIGIDIGGTNVEVALADSSGAILERVRLDTRAVEGPRSVIARIAAAVTNLRIRSEDVYDRPVLAHAAVCAGVVQTTRVLMAPNLPGWENLDLAAALCEALALDEVAVLNDVHAGALAELRFGRLRGVDPGIYLSLGTGIAAALTVNGSVVSGAHRAAGEIGYVSTAVRSGDGSREAALLEDVVGGRALGERSSRALGFPVTSQELFVRTDDTSRHLVGEALEALADAVANLAIVLDPAAVVVGGGMMASEDVILPALADRLKQTVPFPPDLVVAHFTEDASLHGAVALALDLAGSGRSSCS